MVLVVRDGVEYYMDDFLDKQLEKISTKVQKKDEDYLWVVDGQEGSGKSVLTLQLAKRVDPSFDLSRVVFSAKDFKDAVLKASKGQAIVFDEAFRGLSSRGALTEVNKLLVRLMMECRQKNLFIFIVLPTFFLLDRYVAIWRARGLFHVYQKRGTRGYWRYYNSKTKKLLFLNGRQTYTYAKPKSNFHGRFYDIYSIDEDSYRKKKRAALQDSDKGLRSTEVMDQRNFLLWYLHREKGVSETMLSDDLERFGYELGQSSISEIIVKKDRELRKKGVLL